MHKRVTRVLTCGLWGSLMAAGLAGCASDDDLRPISIVHQAQPISKTPTTPPSGATGADVVALARAIQADVQARYGVQLEPEPVFI